MLKHMIKCGTLSNSLLENATAEPGRGIGSSLSSAAALLCDLRHIPYLSEHSLSRPQDGGKGVKLDGFTELQREHGDPRYYIFFFFEQTVI